MITKFGVAGFRGIGAYQEIDLAPITIITGPNSAGKSSLLEALRVSRNLVRTLDHHTLIGIPSQQGAGRLHPEYVFGGDPTSETQFMLTTDRLRDYYLRYQNALPSHPGISIRLTIRPVEGLAHLPYTSTTLELFDDHGPILDYNLFYGRPTVHLQHPIYWDWLDMATSTLRRRAQRAHLVEPALEFCKRGFNRACAFSWPEPRDASLGESHFDDGPDQSYDECRNYDGLDEFALCELSLMSEANAAIAREVVDAIGLDETIVLALELEKGHVSHADERYEAFTNKLGPDRLSRFHDAVIEVDLTARADYASLYTQGQLILQRIRNEALRSVRHVAHVAASRGTPPAIIAAPPSRQDAAPEEASSIASRHINAWLGSDMLGTGYRYVREALLSSSHAQALLASNTALDPRSTRIYHQYLIDLATGVRLGFEDVGYGVAQVLPVLLQLFGRQHTSLHIEQPESHLHPALQAELADAAIISATKLKNQVALETHSEHLILRLLRRIRETSTNEAPPELTLTSNDVAIYYLSPGPQGATTTRIHISADGDFTTPWPKGFFPERLKELG